MLVFRGVMASQPSPHGGFVPPWQIRPKNQGVITIVFPLMRPYFADLFLTGVQIHHGGPG